MKSKSFPSFQNRSRKLAATAKAPIKAFTLIELLLAMAAVTLVFAIVQGLLSTATRMRNQSNEHLRDSRLRARVLSTFRNDLADAYLSGGALASSFISSAQGPESKFPGYLKFSTTGAAQGVPDLVPGDIREVEYFITQNSTQQTNLSSATGGTLVRRINSNLLAPLQNSDRTEELLSGVESMTISLYDGSAWQSQWDNSALLTNHPTAIRVQIQTVVTAKGVKPNPIEIYLPWSIQPISTESSTTNSPQTSIKNGGAKMTSTAEFRLNELSWGSDS